MLPGQSSEVDNVGGHGIVSCGQDLDLVRSRVSKGADTASDVLGNTSSSQCLQVLPKPHKAPCLPYGLPLTYSSWGAANLPCFRSCVAWWGCPTKFQGSQSGHRNPGGLAGGLGRRKRGRKSQSRGFFWGLGCC